VPEGRVPEIVRERHSFGQFRSQARFQPGLLYEAVVRNRTGELSGFYAVSQTSAIEISLADAEDLGFPLEPAKGRAVQDAITIPLRSVTMIFG
jgi:hypothetical protein